MSALHWNPISAIARRQLGSQLGNPLGYVFILAFVLGASALMYWIGGEKFFTRDIADLNPLTTGDTFAWLLVFLLPALAMSSWAGEREHGTEEQLLTLPLSIADAILGKWLAIATFFTIALACSLSNVVVLMWQGNPDLGLVASTYLGWWLAGLVFAALGLLASVLVSLPAVAFVLGAVFSAIAMWGLGRFGFFDGFGRGVVPTSSLVVAAAALTGALSTAALILASRRWRPDSGKLVVAQVLSLLFALILLGNLAKTGERLGIDADISDEGLSSLSTTSVEALRQLKEPVKITAFISQELPPDLQRKGKEVEDKLKALERAARGAVKLDLRRPGDSLDKDGAYATQEFNLKPRRTVVDKVAGRRTSEVFLAAAVQSSGRRQLIESFDPGLSVEYELVRAVRSVSDAKKRVLGIATTDLEINGSFNFQAMSSTPAWEIVEEWKKQYEVRAVSLDTAVVSDIEVLVVPQPSTLTQQQLENLHDAIWGGVPTLLLEDPLPLFQMAQGGRSDLIPGQPKKASNPYGQPEENAPKKGDLQPILRALGVEAEVNALAWSDYNPSHFFRELIPQNFVWVARDKQSIATDSQATIGITTLLLPIPGILTVSRDKPADLTVTPLIKVAAGSAWGRNAIAELTERSPYGPQMSLKDLNKVRRRPDGGAPPALAVEITGRMPSAFPRAEPAKAADPAAEKKTGVPSAKPVHVILVADVDLIDNEFFQFYRNAGNRIKDDEAKILLQLRNVQFLANSVDALFNDKAYLDLRNRRPEERKLVKLGAVREATQEARRAQLEAAQADAEKRIADANAAFQSELGKIDARDDLDEATKAQERQRVQIVGQRSLTAELEAIAIEKERKDRQTDIVQDRQIKEYISWVQRLAVLIPSIILAAIAGLVLLNRLARERSSIPASRRRTNA